MRRRLGDKLTGRRALVVIVGVLLALAWAVPSLGAGVGKVARLALGRANEAVHDANLAINTSDTAKDTANSANSTANSANTTANAAKSAAGAAQSAANAAQSTANTALSTANQALTKANSIVTASYARVASGCATSSSCAFNHSKGVTSVRQLTAGNYCVTASGRSPGGLTPASWLVSVDAGDTSNPGQTQAYPNSDGGGCNAGEFSVLTTRNGSGASDVAFFVVIP